MLKDLASRGNLGNVHRRGRHMTKRQPVYLMLGLDKKGQLLRYFIVEGCGGPLLLLWSIGIGLFLTIFGSPFYAGAWTVMAVTLGLWMTYRSRGNPRVWERLVHASMAERFPWHTICDEVLQETVRISSILVAEVTVPRSGMSHWFQSTWE